MTKLDGRQLVPLTSDEAKQLRASAKAAGLSNGLFARVLILWALEHLDDPDLIRELAAEREDSADRLSAAARAAATSRWSGR
jgi:hypothetical protein